MGRRRARFNQKARASSHTVKSALPHPQPRDVLTKPTTQTTVEEPLPDHLKTLENIEHLYESMHAKGNAKKKKRLAKFIVILKHNLIGKTIEKRISKNFTFETCRILIFF